MPTTSRPTTPPFRSARSVIILLALAVLGAGCDGDNALEPATPPVGVALIVDSVALEPNTGFLSLNQPERGLQLGVSAFDQNGDPIRVPAPPAYSIDAPAVATIDSRGVVRPVSSGTARITAVVTGEGRTWTRSMTLTVGRPPIRSLLVSPSNAVLHAVTPSQTLQLEFVAYDEMNIPLRTTPTFTSDAPGVATVNSEGLIEAVGAGEAMVVASLTVSGVTRSDSTTVRVIGPTILSGVYDLTATITSFDPIWGDLTGAQIAGTLTFVHDQSFIPGIAGTFTGLAWSVPGEAPTAPESGVITSLLRGGSGNGVIIRVGNNMEIFPVGDIHAPVMQGTVFIGGHIGGTFTAVRR